MARDSSTDNSLVLNQGLNPLVNFNFMLRVELMYDLPCKSVKNFTRENEYEIIQEGGLNDYVHMRRKPISRPFTFEVERYTGVDYIDPIPNGADLVLPVMLFVSRYPNYFYPGVTARTYIFTGCTVIKKTYGELDAEHSGLLTETATIAYREMLCLDVPWSDMVKENSKKYSMETLPITESTKKQYPIGQIPTTASKEKEYKKPVQEVDQTDQTEQTDNADVPAAVQKTGVYAKPTASKVTESVKKVFQKPQQAKQAGQDEQEGGAPGTTPAKKTYGKPQTTVTASADVEYKTDIENQPAKSTPKTYESPLMPVQESEDKTYKAPREPETESVNKEYKTPTE